MDSGDPGLCSQNKCNTQRYRRHLEPLAWNNEDRECKTTNRVVLANPWIISNNKELCQGQVGELRFVLETQGYFSPSWSVNGLDESWCVEALGTASPQTKGQEKDQASAN